jgi:hypothetical protein
MKSACGLARGLGSLRLQVSVQDGVMVARMETETKPPGQPS